jgi:L-seryl-tRNA(Ser) seleniumtransferase
VILADCERLPSLFRELPSVERLSQAPQLASLEPARRVAAARHAIDTARDRLREGESGAHSVEALVQNALAWAQRPIRPTLRRAINATGVLLHTNLGRATLAPSAVRAVEAVAAGHATLEMDEESGRRGDRQRACADLLQALTGAEDAFVVNNNAAATFLAIAVLAAGREVVLSRGQLVEIGGQFRLPDVIASAGARLCEVGTTNRTRIADYEHALGPETALLLRVHPSNFRVVGFTEEATLPQLVALGQANGIPVGDDIGSGALVDFTAHGLSGEPMASESVAAGADLIWFSGDKLLGGPQAGILIGKRDLIARMAAHPLARALRPDKLTLAALEATLSVYAAGRAWTEIPILRRIARPADEILSACGRVARVLRELRPDCQFDLVASGRYAPVLDNCDHSRAGNRRRSFPVLAVGRGASVRPGSEGPPSPRSSRCRRK